jgi:hypothetical protein
MYNNIILFWNGPQPPFLNVSGKRKTITCSLLVKSGMRKYDIGWQLLTQGVKRRVTTRDFNHWFSIGLLIFKKILGWAGLLKIPRSLEWRVADISRWDKALHPPFSPHGGLVSHLLMPIPVNLHFFHWNGINSIWESKSDYLPYFNQRAYCWPSTCEVQVSLSRQIVRHMNYCSLRST